MRNADVLARGLMVKPDMNDGHAEGGSSGGVDNGSNVVVVGHRAVF